MSEIRLLLVDDHTIVRAGLRALFDRQPDLKVIGEAETVAAALTQAKALQPDVVVLDLSLPGGSSLDLIGQLQALTPPPRVLMLTMHDDPAYARSALAWGATGYVVKSVSEPDLLAAVRAASRGQLFVDLDDKERTARVLGGGLTGRAPEASKLSERELEVVRLLGQGHTNQAIADRLDISPKTVATYRARIADKLGLRTTADFVRYGTDTGLTTAEPASS